MAAPGRPSPILMGLGRTDAMATGWHGSTQTGHSAKGADLSYGQRGQSKGGACNREEPICGRSWLVKNGFRFTSRPHYWHPPCTSPVSLQVNLTLISSLNFKMNLLQPDSGPGKF